MSDHDQAGLDQIAAALAAFQAEMPTVKKTHTAKVEIKGGGSYGYTYADLVDVTAAAMPLLTKHGLAFTCLPGGGELTGMLMHSSGQHVTASLPIGGTTPQQVGSSLTYMRRYLLGCMTGIVTDDDDDGHAGGMAVQHPPRRESPPQERPQAGPGPITPAQLGALHSALNAAGMGDDRDRALQFYAKVVGHPVGSSKELSKREGSAVIDALKTLTMLGNPLDYSGDDLEDGAE